MRSERQVRVLFINDTARNGGPGRSLHSILKFLDPRAIHRSVVLPRPGPIADLLARDGVADEVRYEPGLVENPIEPWSRPMQRGDYLAPPLRRGIRAVGNVGRLAGALSRLAFRVRRERFDLLYCNGTNADFAGALVAAATGAPALWHVRYTGLPSIARRPHRLLSAGSAVTRIVCVSNAAAGLFVHCREKVAVLHNGLDVEAFDPARVAGTLRDELGLPPGAVVFGSHGRVLRRKGYLELIEAARLALEMLAPPLRERVFFVVVGDTPEDFADDHVAECKLAARRAGLGDRFRMLGFRADVRPLVADFDVAVVPSVYADPLPRSVLESMALAKPVVAFGVGGVAEMLEDGTTGAIVPFTADSTGVGASAQAVQGLARSLLAYALDVGRRLRHGAAGRRRVVESFDARAHARAVEGEIRSACGKGPR
jgi:glycosyltransferase involved in cell wall biosynthesis